MAICHKNGIAHRDIKPQNLLLGADNQPKLSDFGFAHKFESQDELCEQYLGTEGYMSPEIAERTDSYSPVKADIFADHFCSSMRSLFSGGRLGGRVRIGTGVERYSTLK